MSISVSATPISRLFTSDDDTNVVFKVAQSDARAGGTDPAEQSTLTQNSEWNTNASGHYSHAQSQLSFNLSSEAGYITSARIESTLQRSASGKAGTAELLLLHTDWDGVSATASIWSPKGNTQLGISASVADAFFNASNVIDLNGAALAEINAAIGSGRFTLTLVHSEAEDLSSQGVSLSDVFAIAGTTLVLELDGSAMDLGVNF